jgi:hypothetical protein
MRTDVLACSPEELAQTRSPVSHYAHIQGAVKKFPEFCDTDCSVHRESVPPGQRTQLDITHRTPHHPATALSGPRSQ